METQNNLAPINEITLLAKACREIAGFEEIYRRVEPRMTLQKRSDTKPILLYLPEGRTQ
jgi:hypothetical protein